METNGSSKQWTGKIHPRLSNLWPSNQFLIHSKNKLPLFPLRRDRYASFVWQDEWGCYLQTADLSVMVFQDVLCAVGSDGELCRGRQPLVERQRKLCRNVYFTLKKLKYAIRSVAVYCSWIIPTFQCLNDGRGSSCLMFYKLLQVLPKNN